jgi:hypothetical protein
MVKNVYLALFAIALLVSPIYVFESGLPQPPDFLMALLILILATGFIVRPPVHKDLYLMAGLFIGHVTIVNLYWFTQYEEKSFLLTPLYYAFNLATFVLVVSLIKEFRERFIIICQIALTSVIVLELLAVHLLPTATYRAVGTFNNPNQLGYWALLVGICGFVLRREQRISLPNVVVLCGAGYLVMVSLSKAALLSFALLLLLASVCQRVTRPTKLALLGLILGGVVIAVAQPRLVDDLLAQGVIGKVADRLGNIGEQGDDSLAARGYDRIWRHPEHLVFGAGEGAAFRFVRWQFDKAREMHSTLGTVLFSYGIVGFSLFLALLAVVFRRAPLAHMLYSLPIWSYGLTHQGLRDTMLWVFLGMVFGLSHYVRSASPRAVAGAYRGVERGPGLLAGSQMGGLRANRLKPAEAQAIQR